MVYIFGFGFHLNPFGMGPVVPKGPMGPWGPWAHRGPAGSRPAAAGGGQPAGGRRNADGTQMQSRWNADSDRGTQLGHSWNADSLLFEKATTPHQLRLKNVGIADNIQHQFDQLQRAYAHQYECPASEDEGDNIDNMNIDIPGEAAHADDASESGSD